jgi:acyl carrier protein
MRGLKPAATTLEARRARAAAAQRTRGEHRGMAKITEKTRGEVSEIVYDFFSRECEVAREELSDATNVIEDLEGDSLMFLELLEIFKKKYGLNIELKTVGKYVVKNPAETIGKIIDLTMLIIEHENRIAELD